MGATVDSEITTTVILGSGIIGLSTAYFLSQSGNTNPRRIHLIDASPELFHCASGFAGGFLAADCTAYLNSSTVLGCTYCLTIRLGFAPSVADLGALSYSLHAQLAESHNGRSKWGYSDSIAISLSQDGEEAVSGSGEDWMESGTSRAQLSCHVSPWEAGEGGPQWLRRTKEGAMEVISGSGTTAQIDPLRFCQWLLARCQERGVEVHNPARALSLSRDESGVLGGIRISQDGVVSERKKYALHRAAQLTYCSTMHTSSDHIWRMVASRLQCSISYIDNATSDLCTRRLFPTHTESAFPAHRSR